MNAVSGAALHSLGLPVPVRVRTDQHGQPIEVLVPRRGARALGASPAGGGSNARAELRRYAVEAIEECWCVAEEWWRERPVGRTYLRVLVDGGRPLTIYRDDVGLDGRPAWYLQRYATSEGALLGDAAQDEAGAP